MSETLLLNSDPYMSGTPERNHLIPGTVIRNTYIVEGLIGSGGAGTVYKAYHNRLQKFVVLKFMKKAEMGCSYNRKEADILKNLHHPYLPQILDYFEDTESFGVPVIYTVMDFIPGMSLEQMVEEKYIFPEETIYRYTSQLVEAVAYLHRQEIPIIHGDIKPANIIITPQNNICLIDFNISGGAVNDEIIGYTENYAAPEQVAYIESRRIGCMTKPIDQRADIYGIGATLYHVMSGKMANPQYRTQTVPSQELPGYMEGFLFVLDRALNLNPDNRYSTAGEMLSALKDMGKKDRRYKRFLKKEIFKGVAFAVGACIALFVSYRAYGARNTAWAKANCRKAMELYDAGRYEDSMDYITESALKDEDIYSKRQLADLYYIAGDAAFMEADYEQASEFYESSIEYFPNNQNVFCDYAVALARLGNIEGALKVVEQGVQMNLSYDKIDLMKAEIYTKKGESTKAEGYYEKVLEESENRAIRMRAYLFYSDMYEARPEYKDSPELMEDNIEVLNRAAKESSEAGKNMVYRKLAHAYADLGDKRNDAEAYRKALEVYQVLIKRKEESLDIYLNEGLLYEKLKEFENSYRVYEEAAEKYGENYLIYKRMAFLAIDEQMEKTDKNYEMFEYCYEECMRLFEETGRNLDEDPEMLKLESYYKTLKEAGQ